jgi:hypothetical protein
MRKEESEEMVQHDSLQYPEKYNACKIFIKKIKSNLVCK